VLQKVTTPLFIDHAQAAGLTKQVERVRASVRRARRYTTKAESRTGQEANVALHEAEQILDAVLKSLR
jgi:hypothetical protein